MKQLFDKLSKLIKQIPGLLEKLLKKMVEKLKNRNVIFGIIIGIVLLIGAYFIWRAFRYPSSIFTTRPKNVNEEQMIAIQAPAQVLDPTTNLYLQGATTMLKHFDATVKGSTDSRGFYGDERRCGLVDGGLSCEPVTADFRSSGDQMASFRSTVPLIWARYQYFLATGNQDQLEQMLLDLDNLVVNVLDSDEYYLQNIDFNCLLMHELYFSPHLDEVTKTKVARLCNDSQPEMHPESLWEYDQHHHPAYYVDNFFGVANIDRTRIIDDSLRTNYTSAGLQEELNNYLTILGNGGILSGVAYANISTDDKLLFLQREATAALDYLAATDINENNPELYETNLVDYLLVTKETLEWLLTTELAQYNEGACLVNVNLQAYLKNFAPDLLNATQQQTLAKNFESVGGASGIDCLIAANLVLTDRKQQVDREVISRLEMLMTHYGDPVFGELLPIGGTSGVEEYFYPTVRNSYLIGLLSRYASSK